MATPSQSARFWTAANHLFWLTLGAILAGFSIEVFFIPNRLIDGGTVGMAMIVGNIIGTDWIPYLNALFNLPFVFLAYRSIGKQFVLSMGYAVIAYSVAMWTFQQFGWHFKGDMLEVVVIGGALMGVGVGLIIRHGGCVDGSEILGIIIHNGTGLTVGQTVLFLNFFIFGAAGFVFHDWHPPLLSLITYFVVIKVLDQVILGLDDTKSVLIISRKSQEVADAVVHKLGLGLTIMHGRGGFSGEKRDVLYATCERLQLSELKELIQEIDPAAFVAIQSLHEVTNGNPSGYNNKSKNIFKMAFRALFQPKKVNQRVT